jgi:hypothetical protein
MKGPVFSWRRSPATRPDTPGRYWAIDPPPTLDADSHARPHSSPSSAQWLGQPDQ